MTTKSTKTSSSKPIPQEAIDTLPDGMTILGWGGDFLNKIDGFRGYCYNEDGWWSCGKYYGDSIGSIYAAPTDSDIVRLNAQCHIPKDKSLETALPVDADERKEYPIYSGFMCYFPSAISAVSHLSWIGNQQHHPDEELHWDMNKSADEKDALGRHMIDEITSSTRAQQIEEATKMAWRSMANLERLLTGKDTYPTK